MKQLIAFCLLLLSAVSGAVLAIEEPQFQVLEKQSTIEVRKYQAMLVAEVQIDGDFKEATNAGFKLLAEYISGKNTAKTHAGSDKLAMTAPFVLQAGGEKIVGATPMTADAAGGHWRMQFFIPHQYTLATAPTPTDARITLREVPAKKVVVLVFSGLAGEDKVNKKTEELMRWVGSKNFKTIGPVQVARYNVPWTVPFWRRNELWIEIE